MSKALSVVIVAEALGGGGFVISERWSARELAIFGIEVADEGSNKIGCRVL